MDEEQYQRWLADLTHDEKEAVDRYANEKVRSLKAGQNTFNYISETFGFTALEDEMRFLIEAIKEDN